MKFHLAHILFATTAAIACAHSEARCIYAAGEPVRSASGECWHSGEPAPRVLAVWFDFDAVEIPADSRELLEALALRMLAGELHAVAVTAHADRVGDEAYNERLAARRAAAIRAYLLARGVEEKRLRIEPRGEREPLTAHKCDSLGEESRRNAKLIACLQPDRRVEIEVAESR